MSLEKKIEKRQVKLNQPSNMCLVYCVSSISILIDLTVFPFAILTGTLGYLGLGIPRWQLMLVLQVILYQMAKRHCFCDFSHQTYKKCHNKQVYHITEYQTQNTDFILRHHHKNVCQNR